MAIRLRPVARILSLIYAAFGVGAFIFRALTDQQMLTLPLGVLAPLVHLNLNLILPRTANLVYNLLYFVAEVASYALSGWITGAAAVLCFNLVARRMGGVSASFFVVEKLPEVASEQK